MIEPGTANLQVKPRIPYSSPTGSASLAMVELRWKRRVTSNMDLPGAARIMTAGHDGVLPYTVVRAREVRSNPQSGASADVHRAKPWSRRSRWGGTLLS
jgi:hypothetical protein